MGAGALGYSGNPREGSRYDLIGSELIIGRQSQIFIGGVSSSKIQKLRMNKRNGRKADSGASGQPHLQSLLWK